MKSVSNLLERLSGKRRSRPERASKRLHDIKSGKRAWVSLGEADGFELKILRGDDD